MKTARVTICIIIVVLSLGSASTVWAQVNLPVAACSGDVISPRGTAPQSLKIPNLPKSERIQLHLPHFVENKLEAYIYNKGVIVGPRGWHCDYELAAGYGYDVGVKPLSGNFSIDERFIFTDGYQAASEEVAEWADTYFPQIVEQLHPNIGIKIDNGHNWTPGGAYAFPKYKTDNIQYISDRELIFTTPAHHIGIGSQFFPKGSQQAPHSQGQDFTIRGFISLSTGLLGGNPGLCHLVIYDVALPPDLTTIEPYLLKDAQSRPDALPSKTSKTC